MRIIKNYEETLISNNSEGDHIQIIKYNIITDSLCKNKTENFTLSVKFGINIIINILETCIDTLTIYVKLIISPKKLKTMGVNVKDIIYTRDFFGNKLEDLRKL